MLDFLGLAVFDFDGDLDLASYQQKQYLKVSNRLTLPRSPDGVTARFTFSAVSSPFSLARLTRLSRFLDVKDAVDVFLLTAFFGDAVFFLPLPAGRPAFLPIPVAFFLGVAFFFGEVAFFTPADLGLAAALVVVRFFASFALALTGDLFPSVPFAAALRCGRDDAAVLATLGAMLVDGVSNVAAIRFYR